MVDRHTAHKHRTNIKLWNRISIIIFHHNILQNYAEFGIQVDRKTKFFLWNGKPKLWHSFQVFRSNIVIITFIADIDSRFPNVQLNNIINWKNGPLQQPM